MSMQVSSMYIGPKGFPYNYFKAHVYTIELHGPFGFRVQGSCLFQMHMGLGFRDETAGFGVQDFHGIGAWNVRVG